MVILVTGSRYVSSGHAKAALLQAILKLRGQLEGPIMPVIVQGGAEGIDRLARELAHEEGWDLVTFEANWEGRGRSAGHVRNRAMLQYMRPFAVVAYPITSSRGTKDMVRLAWKEGVDVIDVSPGKVTQNWWPKVRL